MATIRVTDITGVLSSSVYHGRVSAEFLSAFCLFVCFCMAVLELYGSCAPSATLVLFCSRSTLAMHTLALLFSLLACDLLMKEIT